MVIRSTPDCKWQDGEKAPAGQITGVREGIVARWRRRSLVKPSIAKQVRQTSRDAAAKELELEFAEWNKLVELIAGMVPGILSVMKDAVSKCPLLEENNECLVVVGAFEFPEPVNVDGGQAPASSEL